jgi:hypothetical protein
MSYVQFCLLCSVIMQASIASKNDVHKRLAVWMWLFVAMFLEFSK